MKKYIIITIVSILTTSLYAQDVLKLEDVKVLKAFEAKLGNVKMIQVQQELPESDNSNPTLQYNISALPLELDYPEPHIRPIAVKKEKLPEYYNGHLKLGAGYPTAFYGDAGYNFHYDELYDFNIGMNYFSFNNDKNITNQKFGNWGVLLDGKYHINQRNTITAAISLDAVKTYLFSDEGTHFLGNRKTYTTAIKARYGNDHFNENNFTYFVGTEISILNVKDENATETYIPINAGIEYDFSSSFSALLKTDISLSYLTSTIPKEYHSFSLVPTIRYNQPRYSLEAGIDLIINNDGDKLIFPRIDAKFEILKEYLVFNLGTKSRNHNNNMHNLLSYNPYLYISNNNITGNLQTHHYAGINGKVNKIKYGLEGGYETNTNKAVFFLKEENNKQFDYIGLDLKNYFLSLNTEIPIINSLVIGGRIDFIKYIYDTIDKSYGLPNTKGNLYISYSLLDNKLRLKSAFDIEAGITHRKDFIDTNYDIDPLYNVSFNAEYDFARSIGAFINIDNIASSNYERWLGYQHAPFNILGGIKVKF